jgi:hypothetical protein
MFVDSYGNRAAIQNANYVHTAVPGFGVYSMNETRSPQKLSVLG